MSTTIRIELPEEIASRLESRWKDLPRAALESLIAQAYRDDALSVEQVRQLFGFATRFEAEKFLSRHGAYDYTLDDFNRDRDTLRNLRELRRARIREEPRASR